ANATFTAPASVTITASASETGGTISNVQFFNGTTLLGTSTTSPYSYSWTNVAAGTYSITAKATDNGGAVTTSAAVNITVNSTTSGGGGTSSGSCVTEAVPSASNYVVRNDWSDQNNGS